jgi:hypothetical protein
VIEHLDQQLQHLFSFSLEVFLHVQHLNKSKGLIGEYLKKRNKGKSKFLERAKSEKILFIACILLGETFLVSGDRSLIKTEERRRFFLTTIDNNR